MAEIAQGAQERLQLPQLTGEHLPKKIDVPADTERGGQILDGKGTLVNLKALEGKTFIVDRSLVTPNPKQPRKYFDPQKIQELKEGMLSVGFETPISAVPYLEGGEVRFFIIDGERRFRSSGDIWPDQIPVTIKWKASEREIFLASLIANENREGHNPIERAEAWKTMIAYYMNEDRLGKVEAMKRVATDVNVSVATIQNHLQLLDLDAEIQDLIIRGKLPTQGALWIKSAQRDFGEKINQARVAALLLANLEGDFSGEGEGLRGGKLTRAMVKQALQKAMVQGGGSQEETSVLEAAANVMRAKKTFQAFRGALGQVLQGDHKATVEVLRNGAQPPEIFAEGVQELVDMLRELYQKIIQPTLFPKLEIPEGAPKFSDYIMENRDRFKKPHYFEVARILAEASDAHGRLLSSNAICSILKERGVEMDAAGLGMIINNHLATNLPPYLEIDTQDLRRRGSRGKLEKVSGYRLKWKEGTKFPPAAK